MSKKPDMTDDWMNPSTSSSYTFREPQKGDPTEYLIERQKRIITFGDPLYKWDFWAKYDTAEARDKELARLHEEHPMWHLRPRDSNPWYDQLRANFG